MNACGARGILRAVIIWRRTTMATIATFWPISEGIAD